MEQLEHHGYSWNHEMGTSTSTRRYFCSDFIFYSGMTSLGKVTVVSGKERGASRLLNMWPWKSSNKKVGEREADCEDNINLSPLNMRPRPATVEPLRGRFTSSKKITSTMLDQKRRDVHPTTFIIE